MDKPNRLMSKRYWLLQNNCLHLLFLWWNLSFTRKKLIGNQYYNENYAWALIYNFVLISLRQDAHENDIKADVDPFRQTWNSLTTDVDKTPVKFLHHNNDINNSHHNIQNWFLKSRITLFTMKEDSRKFTEISIMNENTIHLIHFHFLFIIPWLCTPYLLQMKWVTN